MGIHDFWIFAFTGLMLNLTPGNDMLFVATRSTSNGPKAGVISALGIAAGCFVHILAAVVGLSAIISSSATAFNVIKYLGVGYLVYLGVRALISSKATLLTNDAREIACSYSKIFWQGVLTNVLNPKVAIFFLAFLPQFLNVNHGIAHWQILFLGSWFNLSGAVVNILVALLFGRVGRWLNARPGFVIRQQRITGLVLVGLGVKLAMAKAPD